MKKRLNFLISFLLITAFVIGMLTVSVTSYSVEITLSSDAVLLVNLDTDTVCYSIEPDRRRFASCMSELMTFIVAADAVKAPEEKKVRVTQDFIDELLYSDGSLDLYVGKTLTLRDLLGIMMLGSGSDAAYLIAQTVSGDTDAFVEKMNKRAAQLGCSRTQFVTPGYCESNQHYTTCRDIMRMCRALRHIELYQELMKSATFIPAGLEETEEDGSLKAEQKYAVTTQNSLTNPSSPYYFRYATGGKFTYDSVAMANYYATTTYQSQTYIFVGMHGMNTSERNVFDDAHRMTVWAYKNLADRKVIDADMIVSTYHIDAGWGEYDASLVVSNSSYKTLPMTYSEDKITSEIKIPDSVSLPVFADQSIGTAKIFYDGERIDDVNLVSSTGEGISLLGDLSRLGLCAVSELLPNDPQTASAQDDASADVSGEAQPTEGTEG